MQIDSKLRYLMLVESPEKSKTITKIFRDNNIRNIIVMATVGHFTKIRDGSGYWNTGIDPDNNFSIDYAIDSAKKENVSKLKEQVKLANIVLLAADGDREGEAIAWSCQKFLNIPKSKCKRITYQAINKQAIFDAIENAHDIDLDLVNAAHARSCLDKGLGYRLSPVARKQINCKSVGRCQSAALKLICDREREIINFKPEKYFDLYLHFIKNKTEFRAKYQGTDKKPIKRLDTQDQIDKIFEECKGHDFIVKSIEHKDRNENPRPPFSTATFQQECANKLGLTVKQSADCAQKLFESGKISYHRTDDETFGDEFSKELKHFVLEKYGKEYASGYVTKGKKDENAQEGHEGLHVLDLNLTPDRYDSQAPNDLLAKVYRIIYNRTVACALKPAVIAETTYNIYNNNKHKFTLTSNELRFDGYRIVYNYKDDDSEKEELVKESFSKDEVLKECSFEPVPKETKPASRYKEASFIKELKEKGIGRPSTYATLIETIKSPDRGYCSVESKCLVPTEKGMKLSSFLDEKFGDIININYTRDMEKDLDLIASGKLDYINFLKGFYNHLEESANKIKSDIPLGDSDKKCPECGKPMKLRKGPYGMFYGCTGYPKCKHIEPLERKTETNKTKQKEA